VFLTRFESIVQDTVRKRRQFVARKWYHRHQNKKEIFSFSTGIGATSDQDGLIHGKQNMAQEIKHHHE
jgi:hypothetical protein